MLSPADRVERAVAPWSTYLALPLFAFFGSRRELQCRSFSTGRNVDHGRCHPGACRRQASRHRIVFTCRREDRHRARAEGHRHTHVYRRAIYLCGIGDTVSLLMADQAFPDGGDAAYRQDCRAHRICSGGSVGRCHHRVEPGQSFRHRRNASLNRFSLPLLREPAISSPAARSDRCIRSERRSRRNPDAPAPLPRTVPQARPPSLPFQATVPRPQHPQSSPRPRASAHRWYRKSQSAVAGADIVALAVARCRVVHLEENSRSFRKLVFEGS